MAKREKAAKNVAFVTTYASDYRTVAANGVVGGALQRGGIMMEFFVEGPAIPERTVHALGEGGLEAAAKSDTIEISRRIQVGVYMTTEQAKALAKWLEKIVPQEDGSDA